MATRLTLKEALDDLGWFWTTFTSLVNAPSLLSLLQMVFVEYRFVDALQWIVDGYNEIAGALRDILEPLLAPPLRWFGTLLGLRIELQPHWVPVFIMLMIFVLGVVRAVWSTGRFEDRLDIVPFGLAAAAVAVLGAAAVGVVPLQSPWWAQGAAAAVPAVIVSLCFGMWLAQGKPYFLGLFGVASLLLGAWVFGAVGVASFLPPLARGAAVICMGAVILLFGAFILVGGLAAASRLSTSIGFTILGGFVASGLIVGADAGVKLLIAYRLE